MSESMDVLSMFESENRMNSFQALFQKLIRIFQDEAISFVIVGSVAYSEYAPPRATTAIDFMILESDYDHFKKALQNREIGFIVNDYQQIVVTIKDEPNEINSYDLMLLVQCAPKGLAVNNMTIRKQIFGVQNVPVACPEKLVALWCNAVSNGNFKVYESAKMLIKLQLADIDSCFELIESMPDSDAKKVLRSILVGRSTYLPAVDMKEHLLISSDLFQTHEEMEVAKAERYRASQEHRRRLYDAR